MAARRIVVVGASLAGLRAVESVRSAGWDGDVVLVGDERHLPYDRPPLSKEVLTGRWDTDRVVLREEAAWPDLDVDLRLGTAATGIDLARREVVLGGGERVRFDGLVVATGAIPRMLPGTPELEGVHVLRTLDDAVAIRAAVDAGARVLVVGAGFIGAEVAASARRRGCAVTVLEAMPTPLVRALGEEMGAVAGALHRDEGVELRTGVGVAGFVGNGRVEAVRLADGDDVPADLVVVGVGVRPATDWLEGSGLTLRDGLVCDETCAAVGVDGVYAAGDVARWHNPVLGEMRLEHWTNAAEQGVVAGRNVVAALTGGAPEPYAPVPFFWSDQYDTKIQLVGHCAGDDAVRVVHGSVDERRFVAIYERSGRLAAALGFSMPRLVMQYRRLLTANATWDEALAFAASQ